MTRESRPSRERRRGTKARPPKGRVCAGKKCSVLLSIFNNENVCASCHNKIPLNELPTKIGAFL